MTGRALRPVAGMCRTTRTQAGKPTGSDAASRCRDSTPPADAPTTTTGVLADGWGIAHLLESAATPRRSGTASGYRPRVFHDVGLLGTAARGGYDRVGDRCDERRCGTWARDRRGRAAATAGQSARCDRRP